MKLWCQLPIQMDLESPVFRLWTESTYKGYSMVKRPDTEAVLKSSEKGLFSIDDLSYPGLRFLNDREILKNMLRAEKEGYDGVVVTCAMDPALRAAKQLLTIPVTGILESSLHFAYTMGARFAVITSDLGYVESISENIHAYGFAAKAIGHNPVRAINYSSCMKCLSGGGASTLLQDFEEAARGCIADGAEVIIVACGLMSPMLTQAGMKEVDNVPLIDPMLVGIKVCEMLVDLHKAGVPVISRKGLFTAPPVGKRDEVIASIFP